MPIGRVASGLLGTVARMTITDPLKLAEKLAVACEGHRYRRRLDIPLLALSAACLSLRVEDNGAKFFTQLVERGDTHFGTAFLVLAATKSEHVERELCRWVEKADSSEVDALRDCIRFCLDADLKGMSVEYDLLGLVYGELRGRGDISHGGAFYTPLAVAKLVASVAYDDADWRIGRKHYDPTCGTGSMLIGLAQVMREHGRDPSLQRWRGQDIDGMACALTAVNFVYRGMVTEQGKALMQMLDLMRGTSDASE